MALAGGPVEKDGCEGTSKRRNQDERRRSHAGESAPMSKAACTGGIVPFAVGGLVELGGKSLGKRMKLQLQDN